MKAPKAQFQCSGCHSKYGRQTLRCPSCGAIHTLNQVASCKAWDEWVESKKTAIVLSKSEEPIAVVEQAYQGDDKTIALDDAEDIELECIETGMEAVDHVLGGGLFQHCIILLGAEPGTGKSTLSLQMADACVNAGKRVLVAIGEEHPSFIKGRAKRLGLSSLRNKELFRLLPGKSWEDVKLSVLSFDPHVIFLDSVDRLGVDGFKGGEEAEKAFIVQEACSMAHADGSSRTVVAISHFNGNDEFKGLRANEHDVDVTLVMRCIDSNSTIRAISCEGKNRLGETGVVRYLEMMVAGAAKQGLVSVDYKKATSKDSNQESMQPSHE